MLIAALTAYLLIHFGSHTLAVIPPLDETAALIKKDVADESRQKQALAIVDKMKTTTTAYAKQRGKSIESLNNLLAKRATPTSEIEHAAQPLIAEDKATAEKLLDLRFQLKSVLTSSEWARVFPPPVSESTGARKRA